MHRTCRESHAACPSNCTPQPQQKDWRVKGGIRTLQITILLSVPTNSREIRPNNTSEIHKPSRTFIKTCGLYMLGPRLSALTGKLLKILASTNSYHINKLEGMNVPTIWTLTGPLGNWCQQKFEDRYTKKGNPSQESPPVLTLICESFVLQMKTGLIAMHRQLAVTLQLGMGLRAFPFCAAVWSWA